MPYCVACGVEAKAAARFCSRCGRPLSTAPISEPGGSGVSESGLSGPESVGPSEAFDQETIEVMAWTFDADHLKDFLTLCQSQPDDALRKLSKLVKAVPDLDQTYLTRLLRFVALGQRALNARYSQAAASDIRHRSEDCLREYARLQLAAKKEGADGQLADLQSMLDEVAIVVENAAPGRVQELLGETKLKYAAFGNRVDVSKVAQSALTNEDMREILELWVKSPFIIRAALFAMITNISNGRCLSIALYEQTEVWGASDQMNPIRGQLHVKRDNVAGSHWGVFAAPT